MPLKSPQLRQVHLACGAVCKGQVDVSGVSIHAEACHIVSPALGIGPVPVPALGYASHACVAIMIVGIAPIPSAVAQQRHVRGVAGRFLLPMPGGFTTSNSMSVKPFCLFLCIKSPYSLTRWCCICVLRCQFQDRLCKNAPVESAPISSVRDH